MSCTCDKPTCKVCIERHRAARREKMAAKGVPAHAAMSRATVRINETVNGSLTKKIAGAVAKAVRAIRAERKPSDRGRPGTMLKRIFADLMLESKPDCCDCDSDAAIMDGWGVEGCKQHRQEIIGWLRSGAKCFGRWEKARAASLAMIKGLVNPVDPWGGFVDEAIRMAEEELAEEARA